MHSTHISPHHKQTLQCLFYQFNQCEAAAEEMLATDDEKYMMTHYLTVIAEEYQ